MSWPVTGPSGLSSVVRMTFSTTRSLNLITTGGGGEEEGVGEGVVSVMRVGDGVGMGVCADVGDGDSVGAGSVVISGTPITPQAASAESSSAQDIITVIVLLIKYSFIFLSVNLTAVLFELVKRRTFRYLIICII